MQSPTGSPTPATTLQPHVKGRVKVARFSGAPRERDALLCLLWLAGTSCHGCLLRRIRLSGRLGGCEGGKLPTNPRYDSCPLPRDPTTGPPPDALHNIGRSPNRLATRLSLRSSGVCLQRRKNKLKPSLHAHLSVASAQRHSRGASSSRYSHFGYGHAASFRRLNSSIDTEAEGRVALGRSPTCRGRGRTS